MNNLIIFSNYRSLKLNLISLLFGRCYSRILVITATLLFIYTLCPIIIFDYRIKGMVRLEKKLNKNSDFIIIFFIYRSLSLSGALSSRTDITMRSIRSMDNHLIIWRVSGAWPWHSDYPIASGVYSIIMCTLFFVLFPLGMIIKLFLIDDVSEFVQTAVFLMTALCGIKMLLIQRQRAVVRRLFGMMDLLDEQICTEAFARIRDKGVREASFFNKLLGATYYTTCVFLYTAVLLNPEPVLIWSFWLPYDYRRSKLVYHATLLYQIMGTTFSGMVNSSLDAYGGSMYSVLGSHLEVLGLRMKELGMKNNNQQTKNTSSEETLKSCVIMHSLTVELRLFPILIVFCRY